MMRAETDLENGRMTQLLRRSVAVLDALSAGALVALTITVLARAGASVITLALSAVLLVIAALCALGAVGMWRATRLGAWLTLFVQGLQLPQMETSTLTYTLNMPVALVAGLGRQLRFHWSLAWRPALEITPDSNRPLPWIGINLIALVAVLVVVRLLGERKPSHPA